MLSSKLMGSWVHSLNSADSSHNHDTVMSVVVIPLQSDKQVNNNYWPHSTRGLCLNHGYVHSPQNTAHSLQSEISHKRESIWVIQVCLCNDPSVYATQELCDRRSCHDHVILKHLTDCKGCVILLKEEVLLYSLLLSSSYKELNHLQILAPPVDNINMR